MAEWYAVVKPEETSMAVPRSSEGTCVFEVQKSLIAQGNGSGDVTVDAATCGAALRSIVG